MITADEIRKRVERLRASMEEAGLRAMLVSGQKNIEYLTGRDTGRALVTSGECFLWTREVYAKLYSGLYSEEAYPYDVRTYDKDLIRKEIKRMRLRKIGIENVPYLSYERAKKDLRISLVATDVIERQRTVKTPLEIELLRRSARMAVNGMKKAFEVATEGVREIDALALIEYEIRKQGSDSPPFTDGMLLSSGRESADIHAKAGSKRIRDGSTVVVDLGARFEGYYSDMTRTLRVGGIDPGAADLLDFVDSLRGEAIDRVSPGVKASGIHGFIEGAIEKRGHRFYHSSGHGVGLNVHELPNVGKDSPDTLENNMVFTIEPGIYIPGKYGVRFEDMVLLEKGRTRVLTRT